VSTASHDKHEGGTDAACGVHAFMGGMRRLASIALNHDQDWSASCRAGLELSRQTVGFRGPDRLGGIAMLPSHPILIARRLPSCGLSDRRTDVPSRRQSAPPEFSAALLIGRSHQLNRIGHEPGSDVAYPFHLGSPFVVRRFDEKQPRRRRNGTALYCHGNLHKKQGAQHYECG
jgi:hypothetical protein